MSKFLYFQKKKDITVKNVEWKINNNSIMGGSSTTLNWHLKNSATLEFEYRTLVTI